MLCGLLSFRLSDDGPREKEEAGLFVGVEWANNDGLLTDFSHVTKERKKETNKQMKLTKETWKKRERKTEGRRKGG
jgi:hypothetical protein